MHGACDNPAVFKWLADLRAYYGGSGKDVQELQVSPLRFILYCIQNLMKKKVI